MNQSFKEHMLIQAVPCSGWIHSNRFSVTLRDAC